MADASRKFGSTIPTWVISVLGVGLFFSIIGVAFIFLAPKTDHLTSEAEGVVSRVETSTYTRKRRTEVTYLTYVRFTDSDHQTFEARSVVNGSRQRHYEGDAVTVKYDPRDPEAGCLIVGDEDQLGLFKGLEYLFRYGGGAALIVGVVALVFCLLRSKRE